VIGFFIHSIILFNLTKLFKIKQVRFSYSILIVSAIVVTSFLVALLDFLLSPITSSQILTLMIRVSSPVLAFAVFYFLNNKFYNIDWKKALLMFLLYIGAILVVTILMVILLVLFFPWASNPT